MMVKVLDENRVKILIEDVDVALYNLPFEKLNYDDPFSKSFIFELIQKTYEETGIDFQDSRVMIEVIPGVARSYYVLLTKMESSDGEQIEFDKAERSESELYIYKLSRGGDVIRFFSALNGIEPEMSEIYYYGHSYYVVLAFSQYSLEQRCFSATIDALNEFGSRCKFRYDNMGILAEHGTLIASPDAYGEIRSKK